ERRAAIGDAKALPITNPRTASQYTLFRREIKVSELIRAIKNLVSFTVPREYLAFRPPAIRDESTIEPQPPPPTASTKPPPKPRKRIFLIFPPTFFRLTFTALNRITVSRINVYKETT